MQHHDSLEAFLARDRGLLAKGPVALILAEDATEIGSTVAHHLGAGFRGVVLLAPPELDLAGLQLPDEAATALHIVRHDTLAEGAVPRAINAIIPAARGSWIYWGYNAEYLIHPFCETRSIVDMLTFHTEERRSAMMTYVIDLYAADLQRNPDAVCRDSAQFDTAGYYALARSLPDGTRPERQLDIFGGLRWRFEEHVPWARRRIDRVALFRAQPGLRMRPDQSFSIEDYNTISCPWHHNLTAAVASFRTAKALKANPGSTHAISSFSWRHSAPFQWSSRQLMDLGLMEPGQWF